MRHSSQKTLAFVLVMIMLFALMATACNNGSTTPPTSNPDQSNAGATPAVDKPEPVEPAEPKVVVFCQNADPASIDPHRVSGDQGANVFRNICENLIDYNSSWVIEPNLARSWEQTGENEWTFYLEEGVEFSNGEKFNAAAFAWNLDRGASTEYPRQAMDYIPFYDHSEAVDEYRLLWFCARIFTPCRVNSQPLPISMCESRWIKSLWKLMNSDLLRKSETTMHIYFFSLITRPHC